MTDCRTGGGWRPPHVNVRQDFLDRDARGVDTEGDAKDQPSPSSSPGGGSCALRVDFLSSPLLGFQRFPGFDRLNACRTGYALTDGGFGPFVDLDAGILFPQDVAPLGTVGSPGALAVVDFGGQAENF
jgi:hypothetical protein